MSLQPAQSPILTDPSAVTYIADLVAEHFINVLYFDLGRYLIAAGALTAILFVFRSFAKARRIQKRAAKRADFIREITSSLRTVFVFGFTTLATIIGLETGVIKLGLDSAPLFTIIWQFALIVLAHDGYFYWAHRAMHTKRLFKATHLHHHKSRTPTPWTAYSFSVGEAAIEAAFVPIFLLITSTAGIAYAGMAMFLFLWNMIIRNVMGHAGHELFPAGWLDIPVLRWISTTTHHDLHHSSGYNFGFYFTWWDKMMGTEHPRYAEEFNANAQPLKLPNFKPLLPSKPAEQASVLIMALFAASMALGGPIAVMAQA